MKKQYSCLLAFLVCPSFLCSSEQVFAANPTTYEPGAVQQRALETMDYYRLQKKVKETKDEKADQQLIEKPEEPKAAEPEKVERKISVSTFDIGPSEILTAEELQDITKDYEGREIAIDDLFEAVERINELYRTKNRYLAKAILPVQEVKGGTVAIKLIEGRIGD
nr:hypothetical protein [Desulfobulbaceae bacterium]